MLTTILVVVVVLVIVAAVPVAGFMGYVKIQDRKKKLHPVVGQQAESSRVDKCAGCGEQRIIVSQDDTLCAACYSALRTKKLG